MAVRHGTGDFGLASAPHGADRPGANGGGDRNRTCDPLLAKQELYQLSYAPARAVVGLCGLEPQTLRLSGVRSNHLSYRPVV